MHFDRLASGYDDARPPYPAALWARAAELGALRPGLRGLDLGAGSGQATRVLLAAGLTVTAVEPGPHLAAELRRRHPEVEVLQTTAEAAPLPAGGVDVAVAATSIHWMDTTVLVPRLHRALAPDGLLLVLRNVFGDEDVPVTPFRERVAEVVARRAAPRARHGLQDLARTETDLTASGLLTTVSVDEVRWSVDLDARRVRALFATFSDWTPAEVEEVADAVEVLGGSVTEHYRSWMLTLRPIR